MFDFDFSDEFRKTLAKLLKKDPNIAKAINKKVREIISRDKTAIELYKNLRHDLKSMKRVHITQWLVMTFNVDLNKNKLVFLKIAHRDDVYKN